MISKTAIHATLALARLAKLKKGEYLGAAQIATEIKAPANYLGKLLQSLCNENLVESVKGYGGGFRLKKPASKISIYDIVAPLDNLSRWDNCFLGADKCDCDAPCAVHKNWHKIRTNYLKFLKNTTIAQVAKKEIKF